MSTWQLVFWIPILIAVFILIGSVIWSIYKEHNED